MMANSRTLAPNVRVSSDAFSAESMAAVPPACCSVEAVRVPHPPIHLILVDARVADDNAEMVRQQEGNDERVVVLPAEAYGVAGLRDAARRYGRGGLRDLSILAHGSPGRIEIGADALDADALPLLKPLLSEIGAALVPTGRVHLLSCEVGHGAAGRAFVQAFAESLGRPVSAAAHRIGNAARGGRWDLDVSSDSRPVRAPLNAVMRESFAGLLPATGGSKTLLPTVASITAGDVDLIAGTLDFNVTFSAPADGFDVSNVALSGLAGATVTGITTKDDTTYQVAVSIGTGTSSGTLQLAVTGAATGAFPASPITSYGAGGPYAQAYDLAVGSFAGAGSTDVALVDVGGSEIHIASANGSGSFTPLGTYSTVPGNGAVLSHPQSITVGDFNGDGIPDLAVANGAVSYLDPYFGNFEGTNGDIAILTGKGDGTFDPATFVSVGDTQYPSSIATGDFNGDGIADLVTADFNQPGTTGNQISVVSGKGDGTFSAPTLYTLKDAPGFVATGDLTGDDGTSDVVISTAAGLAIVRDGDFANPTYLDIGDTSGKAAIGDLNGDGIPDIVVPTYAGLAVLLGIGDANGKATGTFAAPTDVLPPQGSTFSSAVIADMTGDGVPDIVAGLGNGFELLTGVGDGTFTTGTPSYGDGTAASLAVADVNGDGVPDVILPSYHPGYNYSDSNPVDTFLNSDGPTGSVSIDRTPGTASISAYSNNYFSADPNDVGAGQSISISLRVSQPFTISGPIILQLNNGVTVTGTPASYYGMPTPPYDSSDYLDFTYTVQNNDNEDTPDLLVTGFAPGSGTITDILGNPVAVAADTGLEIDTTAPSVVAIKQVDSAVTNAATVDYLVTFSEPIDLAQASILIDPSSTDAGAAIESVTSTGINAFAASTSYDVQLSTGTGDGSLKFAFGSDITDLAGNPLAPTPVVPAYTIEHAPPTITSFTAATGGPTKAGLIDYNLTFSQAVQGLAASQFQVTTTGAVVGAAVQSVTSTDGIHYTVAVNAGTGDGTIGLALTGDGVTDLAGNPLGKVYSEATVGGAPGSFSTLLADVNGDGKPDIVSFDSIDVIVRLGAGNGTFGAPISTALHQEGPVTSDGHLVVGDFNGDGRADIAYVDGGAFAPIYNGSPIYAEGVVILTSLGGNAQGTFAETDLTPTQTITDTSTSTIAGKQTSVTDTATSVLSGSYGDSARTTSISAGDINGDGHTDLILDGPVTTQTVISSGSGSTLATYIRQSEYTSVPVVLTNTGSTGTNFLWSGIGQYLPANTKGAVQAVVTADLNGDGKSDILTGGTQGNLVAQLGQSDGTLGQAIATGLPASASVLVGDVNGDRIPDLVGLTPGSNGQSTLNVEIGNGDGTFTAGPSTSAGSGANFSLADLNGDGKLDVLIGNQLYLGDGTGAFARPITLAITNNEGAPTLADLNGDGLPDLVTLDGSPTYSASLTPAVAVSGRPGFTSTDTTIDRTSPSVTIISQGSSLSAPGTVQVSGIVDLSDPGGTVTLYDGTTEIATAKPLGQFNQWRATISIATDGTHVITATDTDAAGNTGTSNAIDVTLTGAQPAGKAEDGYIVGGTVAYQNGSGPATTTDADGNFSLSGGSGPIELTHGHDSATGVAFNGTLTAPAGSTILSPLTTLVEAVLQADPNESADDATKAVATALGLPASTDLLTLDAVAGTQSGDPTATAAFEAGSELLDAITMITALGGSADQAYAAVAADVASGAAAKTTVDLTDSTTVEAVGEAAGLATAIAQGLADIASATATSLATQLAAASTGTQVFDDITGASILQQRDAVTTLSALQNPTPDSIKAAADTFAQAVPAMLGTDITEANQPQGMACYCRGTRIATDAGERAVEALAIGDRLATVSGVHRSIKWIGTRSYAGRFANANPDVLPICFKAGSLGEAVPHRDLWVSPKHAMFLDGVLIPAEHLVNGVSVVKADSIELVEYFHIELDSHDVIVAEGALSETFVDDDSRAMFHNARTYAALYPDAKPVEVIYCAPRVEDGFVLEVVRRRLAERAGLARAPVSTIGSLRGHVDRIAEGMITGWAQNTGLPDAPVCLDVLVDDRVVALVLADRYRPDLARAGIGNGCHSFDVPLPAGLTTAEVSRIRLCRSSDGAGLLLQAIDGGEANRAAA